MSEELSIRSSRGEMVEVKPSVHGERALGFWFYLMNDSVLFGILFANFAVLLNGTAGGPGIADIVSLSRAGIETALLLASSLMFGFATICALSAKKNATIGWLLATFALGGAFLVLELLEFGELIEQGAGPTRSGFLSGFFALLGAHGLHVAFGMIGIALMIVQISTRGLTEAALSRLYRLGLFWHFLDIVWIGIFSFVYLPGVLK
ncbi:cytochrome c oxidase subunit 3 [Lysobacter enzymogenes]|uniref:cytochrome c oxidase subunit 3 n=1 Tax=Lysobacter enzymogenes TaxID=69 RepID=UPI00099C19FC|nr:cytochrome c oxidase subunit 3 [Lysobacter enzymogenes]UZW62204.1 cytochrome c oxidase subunit 3 [Lysobacter enzymogenes]